ncbi:MAG: DUF4440 domain-containing protein [Gammaproteobacteria bacterium]
MKTRTVLATLFVVALAACTSAPRQHSKADDLAAIESFNKRYLKALNDGDYVTLNSLTSEDHMMMMPNQPIFAGKAKLDEANKNAAEKFHIVESWQPIETVVSGDLAYQRGTFNATLTPKAGGPARGGGGKFLRIYRRMDDGSWTMVIDSFSSDKPAKEAQ